MFLEYVSLPEYFFCSMKFHEAVSIQWQTKASYEVLWKFTKILIKENVCFGNH